MSSIWSRRWSGRRRGFALALLVLALCSAVKLPGRAQLSAEFPRVRPAALAHLLADFSHRHEGGPWIIEKEANNYTSWRYSVSYECGARCTGWAEVESHDEAQSPSHGQATAHLIRVRDQRCTHPPLIAWPAVCEETEWQARVRGSASGSLVEEEATTWCSAFRLLSGSCRDSLVELLHRRHQRLRLAVRA